MNKHEWSLFSAMAKEVGRHIDPATAEVKWEYADISDPYGIRPEDETTQVGREYFARSPGSDVWVNFGDLPKTTGAALWEMHSNKLVFPAGLREAARRVAEARGLDPEEFWDSMTM